VRWLLRHGANISSDKFGKTPMNDAAENEQLEVGFYFIRKHTFFQNVNKIGSLSSQITTKMTTPDKNPDKILNDNPDVNAR
jgi:ankyrin repeat protein